MPNEPKIRVLSPPELSKPVGYSHIAEVTSGKLIYVSGQVALDPSGGIVGKNDYPAQLR